MLELLYQGLPPGWVFPLYLLTEQLLSSLPLSPFNVSKSTVSVPSTTNIWHTVAKIQTVKKGGICLFN